MRVEMNRQKVSQSISNLTISADLHGIAVPKEFLLEKPVPMFPKKLLLYIAIPCNLLTSQENLQNTSVKTNLFIPK